jgi:YjbE family integral membrane protein
MTFWSTLIALAQIILIDVSMSGDNAIAIGMAAAGLPASERHRAVLFGIIAATALRILFAVFAVRLLHITGLLAAGGLVLLWVAWKMYRDIRHRMRLAGQAEMPDSSLTHPVKKLSSAIMQIVVADVSMSLDNVLAVVGVARDHLLTLAAGLGLSILLMGVASAGVARLTARHAWISYLGLAIVLFTALRMMWDGAKQLIF